MTTYICCLNEKILNFDSMKKLHLYLFICLFFAGEASFAQYFPDEKNYVKQFSYAVKFAPRIFSPRFTYEKSVSYNSSILLELRAHILWIPQAIRLESAYRYYFKDSPMRGPYIQPKLVLGYFDYQRQIDLTKGVMAGGGLVAGSQFNVGKRKALIDVFGGFQWIAPFYLNTGGNTYLSNYDYNVLHYTLIAFPVELGIRLGFFGTKLVPINTPIPSEF